MVAKLSLQSLRKQFGAHAAVDDVSLDIREGEFFSLLGPSGCGKTTLLRMIAGFETPDSGSILLDGQSIEKTSPDRRPFNLVFQRYALFPHLSVWENIVFGLRMKKVAPNEIERRGREMLSLVQLDGFRDRKIATLSGGQSQRVALARALANRPRVLLLDEPLSALDLQLRRKMQIELLAIQRRLKHTFIFVTHDQEEALALSDRIAVMHEGKVVQVGTPAEIYDQPASSRVAEFIGSANFIDGTVEPLPTSATTPAPEGRIAVRITALAPNAPRVQVKSGPIVTGTPVRVFVRPEKLRLLKSPPSPDQNRIEALIREIIFLGPVTQFLVDMIAAPSPSGPSSAAQVPLIVTQNNSAQSQRRAFVVGERVYVSWAVEDGLAL